MDLTSPRFKRRRLSIATAGPLCALLVLTLADCGSSAVHKTRHGKPARSAGPAIALSSLRGRIALSRNDDVWLAHADGSHPERLTSRPGPEFDPTWSPDGSRIAYRDSRRGVNRNDEIYVMSADGSHKRNLTRSPTNEWSPSWSPDGSLIAFYSGELYVMRVDGRRMRPVTRVEGEYPAWSPDSRRLAFMSAEPGARGSNPNYDIFVVDRDGTGLRRLTDWPGEDGWPAWSPDGKRLAFTTRHDVAAGGDYDIWLMNADGSGKRRVASGSYPVWSPDARAIMFSTGDGGDGQLAVVRPDGSGLRKLPLHGWLPDWHR